MNDEEPDFVISKPYNTEKVIEIKVDEKGGQITGMPDVWVEFFSQKKKLI